MIRKTVRVKNDDNGLEVVINVPAAVPSVPKAAYKINPSELDTKTLYLMEDSRMKKHTDRPSILDDERGHLIALHYPRVLTQRKAAYSAPKDLETMSTKAGAREEDSADLFALQWLRMEMAELNGIDLSLIRPKREMCVLWPVYGSRADFCWPHEKLIVECDGGQYVKFSKHISDDDRDRTNMLILMGYRVLRFSKQQLKRDPWQCVAVAVQALGYTIFNP